MSAAGYRKLRRTVGANRVIRRHHLRSTSLVPADPATRPRHGQIFCSFPQQLPKRLRYWWSAPEQVQIADGLHAILAAPVTSRWALMTIRRVPAVRLLLVTGRAPWAGCRVAKPGASMVCRGSRVPAAD